MPKDEAVKDAQTETNTGETVAEGCTFLGSVDTGTVGRIVASAVGNTANFDIRDSICQKATVELFTALLDVLNRAK